MTTKSNNYFNNPALVKKELYLTHQSLLDVAK